tara:strand:+ start:183 stop:986 length:804 start_codon:yes stop_codon:yes gene_type:complete
MTDFIEQAENQLNEIFSASSVMDVTELRTLYYGRLNLFVTFTDDGRLEMTPDSSEERPAGYVAYSVSDVVGKKVKTSEFYANVYRIKKNNKSREFIDDIKTFTKKQYEDAVERLYGLDYIGEDEIFEGLGKISSTSALRGYFNRLWDLTKFLAKSAGGGAWKMLWREIFLDIGYNGITDKSGSGLLVSNRNPVTIQFDSDIEEFDIVPIQKHKKDPRKRVRTQVNRYVKRLSTARNRVSKKRFVNREIEKDTNKMTYKMLNGILEYL